MVVMLLKEGVGNGGRFTEEKGELDAGQGRDQKIMGPGLKVQMVD